MKENMEKGKRTSLHEQKEDPAGLVTEQFF
jgi:hypothetical protein